MKNVIKTIAATVAIAFAANAVAVEVPEYGMDSVQVCARMAEAIHGEAYKEAKEEGLGLTLTEVKVNIFRGCKVYFALDRDADIAKQAIAEDERSTDAAIMQIVGVNYIDDLMNK